jgi:phosphotransferase system  glucose/maltose/N-acetylglucosamine-specific IIC component
MTTAAWIMLGITWAVIVYFTARYFWMVFRMPVSAEREERTRDGILEKDA